MNTNRETQTVVVGGVPEHFNFPWLQAIEQGKFDSIGIDVTFQTMPGGTGQMMKALDEKKLDVAIVLTEGGIAKILNGSPCRIVKTYVESSLIWGIHVAADSSIASIDEIRGSTYAISRFGSGSHLMAIVDAAERGWESDVLQFHKVKNLQGAREALRSGLADTFFWERFTTAPMVDSGEFRRLDDRLTLWPAFVVCVRLELLESQHQTIKKILEVVNQQCQHLMQDPEACKSIAKRYQLKIDEVKKWFALTKWNTNFAYQKKEFQRAAKYLKKLELINPPNGEAIDVWFDLNPDYQSSNAE
ncbi:MAG: ABC transporter substrate-binding protein [Planctomycetota bacterium]